MTADNPIVELLAGPLSPNWTIKGVAEQLLSTIANKGSGQQEFTISDEAITDVQSRRMIRPLLACLAKMSAKESGTSDDIFGADLSFKRNGPDGPVWIFGQFKNTQEDVRVMLQRSLSPPLSPSMQKLQPPPQKPTYLPDLLEDPQHGSQTSKQTRRTNLLASNPAIAAEAERIADDLAAILCTLNPSEARTFLMYILSRSLAVTDELSELAEHFAQPLR